MRRYISPADTAKLLRVALKGGFPGTKFGVRTSTYSGGGSIRVTYTDGPALDRVRPVAKEFAGSTFNPMIDLKEYRDTELDGERVHFGADFVFVDRTLSVPFLTSIADGINYAKADEFEIAQDSTGAYLNFVGENWDEFLSMKANISRTASATDEGSTDE